MPRTTIDATTRPLTGAVFTTGGIAPSVTPNAGPTTRQVTNNSTLGRSDGDRVTVSGSRSAATGITGGVTLSAQLKQSVQGLESRLATELQVVADKQAADKAAAAVLADAAGKLSFGDKYFAWLGAGDKTRRSSKKEAEATRAKSASELDAARDAANKTDRAIKQEISACLRGQASTCTYADLEKSRQVLQQVLDAARSFANDIRSAISAVDSAISAKQWDNMSDSMNRNNRPNQPGSFPGGNFSGGSFSDMQVMSAKSDAQAAIGRVKGSASGFNAVLATCKPELAGSVGSVNGIDLSNGVFDFFMGNNPWFGMMDVSNMSSTKGELEGLAGQVKGLTAMITAQASSLDTAMEAQISAVRQALRA